jgi:hypothetical protein
MEPAKQGGWKSNFLVDTTTKYIKQLFKTGFDVTWIEGVACSQNLDMAHVLK